MFFSYTFYFDTITDVISKNTRRRYLFEYYIYKGNLEI